MSRIGKLSTLMLKTFGAASVACLLLAVLIRQGGGSVPQMLIGVGVASAVAAVASAIVALNASQRRSDDIIALEGAYTFDEDQDDSVCPRCKHSDRSGGRCRVPFDEMYPEMPCDCPYPFHG